MPGCPPFTQWLAPTSIRIRAAGWAMHDNGDRQNGARATAVRATSDYEPLLGDASAPIVRVMVADLHPVLIEGLQARIASEADLATVDGVIDLSALAGQIDLRKPHVTLVGFNLWQSAEPETALNMVRAIAARTRVILIYDHIDPHQAWRALHAGVVGLISRSAPAGQFVFAIHQTLRDGTFLDATIQEELAGLARGGGNPVSIMLTRREQTILEFSADGLATRQIATQLALSPSSIKVSLHEIYGKLGVHDRPAAVAQALRLGLIT